MQHLIHANVAKNKQEARKIARQALINMGKVAVEVIKVDQILTPENFKDHVVWNRSKETEKAMHTEKGLIVVGAHFGNWEVAGLGCSVLVKPTTSIMRPLDNKKIGNYLSNRRTQFKQTVCAKQEAIKPIFQAIKKGNVVAIVADQHASTNEGVETVFFGHPARTHTSPAFLHMKTGTPIVLGVSRRIDDNFNFEFIMRGPYKLDNPTGNKEEDIEKLTQMFTTDLEEIIAKYPEQWLWSHRRWLDINRKRK